jgi:hypothetical protein
MNTNTTKHEPVQVVLRRSNVLTRWPCHICGGTTEKESVNAEFTFDDGRPGFVCGECLRHPDAVSERLRNVAQHHEAAAVAAKEAAEHDWHLPAFELWSLANYGRPDIRDYPGDHPPAAEACERKANELGDDPNAGVLREAAADFRSWDERDRIERRDTPPKLGEFEDLF